MFSLNSTSRILRQHPWLWGVSRRWDDCRVKIQISTADAEVLARPLGPNTLAWVKCGNSPFGFVNDVQRVPDAPLGKMVLDSTPLEMYIEFVVYHNQNRSEMWGPQPYQVLRSPRGTNLRNLCNLFINGVRGSKL